MSFSPNGAPVPASCVGGGGAGWTRALTVRAGGGTALAVAAVAAGIDAAAAGAAACVIRLVVTVRIAVAGAGRLALAAVRFGLGVAVLLADAAGDTASVVVSTGGAERVAGGAASVVVGWASCAKAMLEDSAKAAAIAVVAQIRRVVVIIRNNRWAVLPMRNYRSFESNARRAEPRFKPLVLFHDSPCQVTIPPRLRFAKATALGVGRRAMKHFLLFYEGAPDYLERRPQYRGAHLEHAWAAHERGELVVAGAFADPVDGAALMFQGADRSVAEMFARADPYVTNGLVAHWIVREWNTVVGERAANPVRPGDL
jgi:hypothetical protein